MDKKLRMFQHGQDIYNCFIDNIEVIWQENSKPISQIDSTFIIPFFAEL
jgi:hypothetical protein